MRAAAARAAPAAPTTRSTKAERQFLPLYSLDRVIEGALEPVIEALQASDTEERLREQFQA